MKKVMLLLALLLAIFVGSVSGQEVKDGFKGYKWGTPFDSMKTKFELKLIDSSSHGRQINYITNITSIGEVSLENCCFLFYRGAFQGVIINTKGYTNSQAMLKALTVKYGKPTQENEYIKKYHWLSVGTNTLISFNINSITDDGFLVLGDTKIYEQQIIDEKKDAEKAAKEF